MLAHNCRTPLSSWIDQLNNYVDCTDLLGVSVTSRIKERNVNSSVQKFYCRVQWRIHGGGPWGLGPPPPRNA